VIALVVVVAALLLAIVVAVLLVGGEHGPGRHSMGSGAGQLSVDAAQ
jgi:preprotein translocase subunit SecG